MTDNCILLSPPPSSRNEAMSVNAQRMNAGVGSAGGNGSSSSNSTSTTGNRSLLRRMENRPLSPLEKTQITDMNTTSREKSESTSDTQRKDAGATKMDTTMTSRTDSQRGIEMGSEYRLPQHSPSGQQKDENKTLSRHSESMAHFTTKTTAKKRNEDDVERQGPAEASSEIKPTQPLHEQEVVKPVEPMDINYQATTQSIRLKNTLMHRLDAASVTGRIQVLDFSRRGLQATDAKLIRLALRGNQQLAVLKLGYNNFGDEGAKIIASSCSVDGRHHTSLTILDLGFNAIGDDGCTELSLHMVAGNYTLRNLFLSGNNIRKKGIMALSGAILHGCSIEKLYLAANHLGPSGFKVLSGAVAEMDARRQSLLQRQGGIVIAAIKPYAVEHLLLDNTSLNSKGIMSLSGMLMSNHSLCVLGLSNNRLTDQDMTVLSQAFTQNKNIPLVAIDLSFNRISCIGVEAFMNAVWGSTTLKEIKLDNNEMQDRGAQLCSVVLGAISLAVLDISFNHVSTVGVKALMKSLSENNSLKVLSLSGIPLDQNASKAISYALAYNRSLEKFHIDSCCVGYSGQRHIVAGMVSNRSLKLRSFSGFPLGPITKTLGLPQIPEDWPNDRALSFIRYMWLYAMTQDMHQSSSSRGPAPPAAVAASGKAAFAALSASDERKIQFQQIHASSVIETSPVCSLDAAILVRSESGQNLQIPIWGDDTLGDDDSWADTDSLGRSSISEGSFSKSIATSTMSPKRRNTNLQWARAHIQSLTEVASLSFNNADLWQLHQYYFSPAYTISNEGDNVSSNSEVVNDSPKSKPSQDVKGISKPHIVDSATPSEVRPSAVFVQASDDGSKVSTKSDNDIVTRTKKRGGLAEAIRNSEPCAKRAKNLRPRIAFFPRIREKLESLGAKPSTQTLCLLRQLKYVENTLLNGKTIYTDNISTGDQEEDVPGTDDVEMILLDLL